MSLDLHLRHSWPACDLDVSLRAPEGVTALFGKSGAGKTTIAKAISGLFTPDSLRLSVAGRTIVAEGRHVPPHKRRIGHVFQEPRLFPHLSVRRNLSYGGQSSPLWEQVVDTLGIAALLDRFPGHLSGGEAQRVAIGRAILSEPCLLVLDEPFSALDLPRRDMILTMLEELRDQLSLPMLFISHSIAEIARLATTVAVLDQGRVAHFGSTADVLSDPSLAPLIGIREMGAVLTAKVDGPAQEGLIPLMTAAGGLLVPKFATAQTGSQVRLRIPAQDVMLALHPLKDVSALNQLPGVITALQAGAGPGVLVQLDVGGQRLLSRVTQRSADRLALAVGLHCTVVLKSVSVAQGAIGAQG